MMLWPIKKKLTIYYFYIFLFFCCFIVARRSKYNTANIARKQSNINPQTPNTTLTTNSKFYYYPPINCQNNHTLKCPKPYNNNQPTTQQPESSNGSESESCPSYFKWIHEDLSPWKTKGITKEMVEAGKKHAFFRLIIINGKLYVEKYKSSFQTRDVFTIWGILQLLRLYPGMIPDLELMFECDDKPVIKKSDYNHYNVNYDDGGVGVGGIPPMFHYCGDDFSFDIPFPDWSFWGWHEINIKPWEKVMEEMKVGNERVKWMDRAPYAYWKGNLHMGRRRNLVACNSTGLWNTLIYSQKWAIEEKRGFRQSNMADQCTHRYKIYMEGQAWSVSEKYIQACDSMLLLVTPRYYEFYTRSLLPLKHFWPVNPTKKLCNSLKFAVDWGNNHPLKAQEIGKAGQKFIEDDLKMKNIYDYMFHLLNEYSKLLKYKPSVPQGAKELCLENMVCDTSNGKEKQWKIETIVKTPSLKSPCVMPPPYDALQLQDFFRAKYDVFRDVGRWEDGQNVDDVSFT
ncbi:hypothetical protein RND81_01G197000 [Saponaria officinalis]|uniref:Glycosyl transferase CAP10 domain-containing protein n=1 Tax=Saponaria officinalis TaxID=3572 RepID=A0AAW1NHH5_SAPOF